MCSGVLIASLLYVQGMATAELLRGPIAPILRKLGIFPVRRGKGDIQAVRTAADVAGRGHPVGIFPEGTRRAKGFRKSRAPRAHTDAARVAIAARVPLV